MPSNARIRKVALAQAWDSGCRCDPEVHIKQPSVSKGKPLRITVKHEDDCIVLKNAAKV